MTPDDIKYKNLTEIIAPYTKKGRSESASFLNWFLENIYRLGEVEADDAICDASNDKGIDAIYVDENNEQIHFFQSKIRQSDGATIGDVDLKNLTASVRQFDSVEKIEAILSGDANVDLKRLIEHNNISGLIEKGFDLKGVYVTNENHDKASIAYSESEDSIIIYERIAISENYVEINKKSGIDGEYVFDIDYVEPLHFQVGGDTDTYIFPAKALQLVHLDGIADGSLFTQNVRYSLGNTAVNKSIKGSISNKSDHKNFTLFHNGVIVLCANAEISEKKLKIENYAVVNGAQSLTTFYHNKSKLTDDLRVLVKVISLKDEILSKKITEFSNNQNAIKPRDMRSNHDLMTRLQSEFQMNSKEYFLEIKRGEAHPDGVVVITNDIAGRILLAFDLEEPYSCHQIYKIFDEKYAEIFGRKEVTHYRIIFLYKLYELVLEVITKIENRSFAGYGLTKFFILYVIGRILRSVESTSKYVRDPSVLLGGDTEAVFYDCVKNLMDTLIIDLNYEVNSAGDTFDYKSDMKSPKQTADWGDRLIKSFEKDVARGKAEDFSALG